MLNKRLIKKSGALIIALSICVISLSEKSYANDSSESVNITSKIDMEVYASGPWYYANILLPKPAAEGTSWWRTTGRKGTRNFPGTGVNKPTYDVIGNISNTGNKNIGKNATHTSGQDTHGWHETYTKGATIKGAFRNRLTNVFSNRVNLRWTP